jgi:hypothetical protein
VLEVFQRAQKVVAVPSTEPEVDAEGNRTSNARKQGSDDAKVGEAGTPDRATAVKKTATGSPGSNGGKKQKSR